MKPTEHLAMGISLVVLTVGTSRPVKSVRSALKGLGLSTPAMVLAGDALTGRWGTVCLVVPEANT
jgi:hypothetical protein